MGSLGGGGAVRGWDVHWRLGRTHLKSGRRSPESRWSSPGSRSRITSPPIVATGELVDDRLGSGGVDRAVGGRKERKHHEHENERGSERCLPGHHSHQLHRGRAGARAGTAEDARPDSALRHPRVAAGDQPADRSRGGSAGIRRADGNGGFEPEFAGARRCRYAGRQREQHRQNRIRQRMRRARRTRPQHKAKTGHRCRHDSFAAAGGRQAPPLTVTTPPYKWYHL